MSSGETPVYYTQHPTRLFGSVGAFCLGDGVDRQDQGSQVEAEEVLAQPIDEGAGVSGGNLGWAESPAGYQPGRPSAGQRPGGGRSLGSTWLGRLHWDQPDIECP
jgi:hypothetical protein